MRVIMPGAGEGRHGMRFAGSDQNALDARFQVTESAPMAAPLGIAPKAGSLASPAGLGNQSDENYPCLCAPTAVPGGDYTEKRAPGTAL